MACSPLKVHVLRCCCSVMKSPQFFSRFFLCLNLQLSQSRAHKSDGTIINSRELTWGSMASVYCSYRLPEWDNHLITFLVIHPFNTLVSLTHAERADLLCITTSNCSQKRANWWRGIKRQGLQQSIQGKTNSRDYYCSSLAQTHHNSVHRIINKVMRRDWQRECISKSSVF